LILKVTLRSGIIVVSPFKTFMNFRGFHFFILENSEIQFLLSINKLYIPWQLLKFVLFESQISFIVCKLLCRNEVSTIGLLLKVIIYLVIAPCPDKTPYQSCYFFYVFFWHSSHFNFVTTKRDQNYN
jgi:hypothetical protein